MNRPDRDYANSCGIRRDWSSRRNQAYLACLYIAALAYASWLPFTLTTVSVQEFKQQFEREWSQPVSWSLGADFLGNLMLGIPLGFLVSGSLQSCGTLRRIRAIPTVMIGLAAGIIIETGQIWIVPRIPCKSDIVAQAAGSLIGVLVQACCGETLFRRIRLIQSAAGTPAAWKHATTLYIAAFLVFTLLPVGGFEAPATIKLRWEEIRTTGISPAGNALLIADFLRYIKKVLIYVPFGVSGFFYFRTGGTTGTYLATTLMTAVVSLLIEAAHLTMPECISDLRDVPCAALGAASGVKLMQLLWNHPAGPEWNESTRLTISQTIEFAAFAFVLCLFISFWYPFRISFEAESIAERIRLFFSWPLAGLWQGSNANAVGQMVLKLGAFCVLGGLLALSDSLYPQQYRDASLRITGAALLVGLAIELGQIPFLGRIPDLFDALLAAGGGWLGFQLVGLLVPCKAAPHFNHPGKRVGAAEAESMVLSTTGSLMPSSGQNDIRPDADP